MLDDVKNDQLTRVGAGTLGGELMRRHWQPIAAVTELDEHPTKPIRLLGEDLVLYRDLSGQYGLIDRHCAHRSADLSYGFVEECGLRCNYHGWLFDQDGKCLEQPYEDIAAPEVRFRDKVRIKSYKVEAKAGLLWAYLGPDPAPLVPNWEPFTWRNGFVQIVFSEIPCNWFQCQENSIDPVHFEWMHDNWGLRLRGQNGPYAPKHLKLDFEEFEHGFVYKRIREGANDTNPLWTIGRVCLWPHALFTGGHFEWRVPIDDERTLSVGWFYARVPKDREPYVQDKIPYWNSPVKDEQTGRWLTSHIMQQDFVAWVGQGAVTNRKREHLGQSDRGIVMMRRRFQQQAEALANGSDDLKGVIRDPAVNDCIMLPIATRDELTNGLSREAFEKSEQARRAAGRDEFAWLVGQPDSVRDAYRAAMGIQA